MRMPSELYHISFNDNLPNVLSPQLPAGSHSVESKDTGKFMEPDIPRVCLSTFVVGCVRAIYPNISEMVESRPDEVMSINVYRVTNVSELELVSPKELAEKHYVHDALVTDEWWALNDVRLRRMHKVDVRFDVKGSWILYKAFGDGEVLEHSPKKISVSRGY